MIPPLHRIRTRPAVYAAAVVFLAGLSWSQPAAGADSLTVVSWGGSYARACQKAQHEPFTAETGIDIRLEAYNGGLAQIRAEHRALLMADRDIESLLDRLVAAIAATPAGASR